MENKIIIYGDKATELLCQYIGVNTLSQAKELMHSRIKMADERNRNASMSKMKLEKGDFVKGIGNVKHLETILQNGSVSKEYLGVNATSDATPLDTDVSIIIKSEGTNIEKMRQTEASNYGPIYFVLKHDERFITTRDNSGRMNEKNDTSKIEAFRIMSNLGAGHYGIRTGFSSSDINYIFMSGDYDERVGLEVAMNGFYIPVVNMEGEIVFSPKEYDNIRAKMQGLSYYGEKNYTFSKNLITPDIENIVSQLGHDINHTKQKKIKIYKAIEKAINEQGLQLKTRIDGDLTEGFVEIIDTGSTSRHTNIPGNDDLNLMMRLDRAILSDASKTEELKQILLKKLEAENSSELGENDKFSLEGVPIGKNTELDVDITFSERTDDMPYSTDAALQDRLSTIKKQDPEKYKYVIANIIYAKQVLKQANVYKKNNEKDSKGGLDEAGVENWILQNGGSFIDAAQSFIESAKGKGFEEFKQNYHIWNFGKNSFAEKQGLYSHENFVTNMSESDYQRMTKVLKEYVKKHSKSVQGLVKETLKEQRDVTFLDQIECEQKKQENIIGDDNKEIKQEEYNDRY